MIVSTGSYPINTYSVMHVPANFCTVINNYYPVFRQIEMEQRVLIPGVIRKLDEVCFLFLVAVKES
jgi:hypothetical protein